MGFISDFFKNIFKKKETTLKTERLILRPWNMSDDEDLYFYAKDERVGPPAGWNPHKNIYESRHYIRTLFSQPHIFALVLKKTGQPVGCVGISIGRDSNLHLPETEGEIGYWIGFPYWGQGLMPEAVEEILRYGFEELMLDRLWCGYFEGNNQSKRVQEKCGFKYQYTLYNLYWEQTNVTKTEYVTCIKREEWMKKHAKTS